MHYKRMFDDKEFLYAFDLDGREVTVEIEQVRAGEIAGEKGRKSKKPVVKFKGKEKKLALNKTNGKTIAALYGTDTDGWVGKQITIYPTTTDFGGETVECIRVKPQVPQAKRASNGSNGSRRDQSATPPADGQSPPALTDEDKRAIQMAEAAEAAGE